MAEDDDANEEETQMPESTDRATGEQGKALERMADTTEDVAAAHLSTNAQSVQEALQRLLASEQERVKAALARDKELAAVKVATEDVDTVASELELDRKAAERRLRENGGDLARTLKAEVFGFKDAAAPARTN
jgi:hypothetical protein